MDNKDSVSQLVIVMTLPKDSGYYQCRAENEAGYASAAAFLKVKTSTVAPDPPTDLQAISISSTEVEISWTPAPLKNHLKVFAYTLHYLPTNSKFVVCVEMESIGIQFFQY